MPVEHSPPTLRPRQGKNQISKTSSIPQPIAKSSDATTKQNNNEFSMSNTYNKYIKELKAAMEKQKQQNELAIKEMKSEIEKKCAKYEKIIESITNDMNQMKKQQHQTTELIGILNATRFHFNLPIGFNKSIEAKIIENNGPSDESKTILKRIQDIETKNVNIEKAVNELINFLENNLPNNEADNSTTKTKPNEQTDEYDHLLTGFKCINDTINNINVAIFKNEEKITKMYAQIHLLSAKYIKFNEKICNFTANLNKKSVFANMEQIIDDETLPFLVTHQANHKSQNKSPGNKFSSKERSTNPFKQKIDIMNYTKAIRATVENTKIANIDHFVMDFKREFEDIMGKNIVKSIVINKYQMDRSMVNTISIIVNFNVPLNLQYIDNFKFPKKLVFLRGTNASKRKTFIPNAAENPNTITGITTAQTNTKNIEAATQKPLTTCSHFKQHTAIPQYKANESNVNRETTEEKKLQSNETKRKRKNRRK